MDTKGLEMIANAVKQFISKNKVKIIIGTPCFGGMIHNGFFQSMLELSVNFTKLNIPFEMMTIGNESLIQRARNGIVAKFLADSNASHLMFIDADITFSWINIVKLLLSGKELCGGCYPKKCFNWDKIKHQVQKNPNLSDDELMAKSLDYVFNPIYHKEGENVVIRVNNGLAQVKDIGTGFMLINKNVINKMIKKYPETKFINNVAGYGQNSSGDYFYALFDCCIDPISRVYLSEDYLFCKRWIDMGGELWLDLSTNLNHTGIIDYKGCLSITIGEVDNLNKDAQIMTKQRDNNLEKDKALMRSQIEEKVKLAKAEQDKQETLLKDQDKKKKKKNKNKNKNKNSGLEVQIDDENDENDENDESNDESGESVNKCNAECNAECNASDMSSSVSSVSSVNSVVSENEEVIDKMKNTTHC